MDKDSLAHWHQKIRRGWETYGPPVRPSPSELKIIEKHIKKGDKRVLILGATPELRDLARKLKKEVTVCDISLEMMITMAKYMKYRNEAQNEILVKSDWLKAPLRQGYWDVVLGDFVICNVPFKLQNSLYKKIASFLKKDGYFIPRMYFANEPLRSFNEIVEEFLKRNGSINNNEFCLSVISSTYNRNNYQIQSGKGREFLKAYLKGARGKEAQKVRKYFKIFNFQYTKDKTWWSTPAKIRDKMLSKYFRIIKKELGNDHKVAKSCPIYLLKKK